MYAELLAARGVQVIVNDVSVSRDGRQGDTGSVATNVAAIVGGEHEQNHAALTIRSVWLGDNVPTPSWLSDPTTTLRPSSKAHGILCRDSEGAWVLIRHFAASPRRQGSEIRRHRHARHVSPTEVSRVG